MSLLESMCEEEQEQFTVFVNDLCKEVVELSNKNKACMYITADIPLQLEPDEDEDLDAFNPKFFKLTVHASTEQVEQPGFLKPKFKPSVWYTKCEISVDEFLELYTEVNGTDKEND